MQMNEDIDAVVLWVDDSDPEFIARHDQSKEEFLASQSSKDAWVISSARSRDNGELRYCLRSIEQNLPWVRKIHLVTNGQRPKFIDFTNSKKISLVPHSAIFDAENLPCYNTFAIESYLHRIPGLAPRFIRFSDDFFIGRPVDASVFEGDAGQGRFYLDGKISLPGLGSTTYQLNISNNAAVFYQRYGFWPNKNIVHAPQLRSVELIEVFLKEFWGEVKETRSHTFRCKSDLIMLFAYPYFVLSQVLNSKLDTSTGSIISADVVKPTKDVFRKILLGDKKTDWRRDLKDLSETPPMFFNLNDNLGAEPDQEDVKYVVDILEHLFPAPASFEIQ